MVTEHEGTPESAPPKSDPKISYKSVIGVAFLLLLVVIASVRPEEDQPPWTRELPGRIDPPLETPLSLVGPVTFAGVVLGDKEIPVGGALVMTGSGELLAWDYTDDNGRFALDGLPASEILVRVIGDGHEPEDFTIVDPRSESVWRLQLTTPLPETPSLPELEYVDITGIVTAPRKDWVIVGYELLLKPMSPPQEFGAPLASRSTIQADRSVSFSGLIAGRYHAALLPPWAPMGTWPNLLDPETPVVVVGSSEESHLEFKMVAGEIEGTVIDDRGKLVAQALVGVHPEGESNQVWPPARTDEHGHFVLRDIPVGEYVLHAHAGLQSVEHVIQMTGPLTLQVDLSLRR